MKVNIAGIIFTFSDEPIQYSLVCLSTDLIENKLHAWKSATEKHSSVRLSLLKLLLK